MERVRVDEEFECEISESTIALDACVGRHTGDRLLHHDSGLRGDEPGHPDSLPAVGFPPGGSIGRRARHRDTQDDVGDRRRTESAAAQGR